MFKLRVVVFADEVCLGSPVKNRNAPSEMIPIRIAVPPSTNDACSSGIVWPGVFNPQYASTIISPMKIKPKVTKIGLCAIDLELPRSMNGSKKIKMKTNVTMPSAIGRPGPSKTEILRIW